MPFERADFVRSISDALQFIACYHSADFVEAMNRAYEREESPAAKQAIAQILINSKLAAEGHRPICQDTGIVVAFVEVGSQVRWDTDGSLEDWVNEGVRDAYLKSDNPLRASIVSPAFGERRNTHDNTPAVAHVRMVAGRKVRVSIAAKGAGSENKSRFTTLNPSDSVADWVLGELPKMGAGWCPPGVIGIGMGGTAEKAMLLAKESLMHPIDIQDLQKRGAKDAAEELRLDLYERINQLGIGAQGLGGLTTVLDVKVSQYPTHAGSLPVALIPNCAATRHVHFELEGKGPAEFTPPSADSWPSIAWQPGANSKSVNLQAVDAAEVASWKPGDMLLLSGKLLTARDAAHKRIAEMTAAGEKLPVDMRGRFIYYVGPVDAVRDEVTGPAGPTTATRMDKFTELMLGEIGIAGMIGKAERGADTIKRIRHHKSVYLIAVGGAAYLVAKAIREAKVVGFEDLGMEAIHEFTVEDMPVTVAVDSRGDSIHESGPKEWKTRIEVAAPVL